MITHSKRSVRITMTLLILVACSNQGAETTPADEVGAGVIVATNTFIPTATPAPTDTPLPPPTDTPVPPPTEVPRLILDDFSSQSDIWGECTICSWEDGAVTLGPFPPKGVAADQVFYLICEACGEHTYYRVGADVTFVEGYGSDRTFGILAGLVEGKYLGGGTITTRQHVLYETFDFRSNQWGGPPSKFSGAVKPGEATNRIEVVIKETTAGYGDIYVYINGKSVIQWFNRPVEPSKVGLYVGWHSVGIKYDNFEFEVLDAEA